MLSTLRSNPLNDRQPSEQVVQSTSKVIVKFVSVKSFHYTKICSRLLSRSVSWY